MSPTSYQEIHQFDVNQISFRYQANYYVIIMMQPSSRCVSFRDFVYWTVVDLLLKFSIIKNFTFRDKKRLEAESW